MELFSDQWMKKFMDEWNNENNLSGALEKIGFSSTIAYGFDGDEQPRGVINVENGMAISAGSYNGEQANWDLRARETAWKEWMQKEMGMMGLGAAYTTRKLKFAVGDYKAMLWSNRTGHFNKR